MVIDMLVYPEPFPDREFLFSQLPLDITKIDHENFQVEARTANSDDL